MGQELSNAEKDADASFWYDDVGGSVAACSGNKSPTVVSSTKTHWVEISMVDKDGNAAAGERYEITLPNGDTISGDLDVRGNARIEGIDPGYCKVRFPGLDKTLWKKK